MKTLIWREFNSANSVLLFLILFDTSTVFALELRGELTDSVVRRHDSIVYSGEHFDTFDTVNIKTHRDTQGANTNSQKHRSQLRINRTDINENEVTIESRLPKDDNELKVYKRAIDSSNSSDSNNSSIDYDSSSSDVFNSTLDPNQTSVTNTTELYVTGTDQSTNPSRRSGLTTAALAGIIAVGVFVASVVTIAITTYALNRPKPQISPSKELLRSRASYVDPKHILALQGKLGSRPRPSVLEIAEKSNAKKLPKVEPFSWLAGAAHPHGEPLGKNSPRVSTDTGIPIVQA